MECHINDSYSHMIDHNRPTQLRTNINQQKKSSNRYVGTQLTLFLRVLLLNRDRLPPAVPAGISQTNELCHSTKKKSDKVGNKWRIVMLLCLLQMLLSFETSKTLTKMFATDSTWADPPLLLKVAGQDTQKSTFSCHGADRPMKITFLTTFKLQISYKNVLFGIAIILIQYEWELGSN